MYIPLALSAVFSQQYILFALNILLPVVDDIYTLENAPVPPYMVFLYISLPLLVPDKHTVCAAVGAYTVHPCNASLEALLNITVFDVPICGQFIKNPFIVTN